jgi:hypothetical protein
LSTCGSWIWQGARRLCDGSHLLYLGKERFARYHRTVSLDGHNDSNGQNIFRSVSMPKFKALRFERRVAFCNCCLSVTPKSLAPFWQKLSPAPISGINAPFFRIELKLGRFRETETFERTNILSTYLCIYFDNSHSIS